MSKILDAQIDALYAVPLSQFVAARTALAKTVSGDEAKRIKSLAKPTTLPWVVNQVRWHERTLYERVLKAGASLRAAQIAALEGRGAKAAEAGAAHKKALADVVAAGRGLAARSGVQVDVDALQRMFETVSLADSLKEAHGRFTDVVQPAGFEALLGVAVKATPAAQRVTAPGRPVAHATTPLRSVGKTAGKTTAINLRAAREAEQLAREQAEAAARRQRLIAAAERRLTAAKEKETAAREAWHEARDRSDEAERALKDLRDAKH